MLSRRKAAGALFALVLVALAAVAAAQSGTHSAKADHVNYATSFGNFGRDSYVYVAEEKGYFKDENLEVSITGGNGSGGNMQLLVAGKLDIAPVDFTALVLSRANEGLPVKMIYQVNQSTLSAILALKESGIASPKDLEGKKIADTAGSTIKAVFPLYAKKSGIDASKVTFLPATPPALPALLASKQVDAVGQFIVGIPLLQKAAGGKPLVAFPYAKYFPGLMGVGLAASDETLSKKADVVKRFVRAIDRALRYSLDNPGDAGRILNKYQPLSDYVVAAQEVKIIKPYDATPATKVHGLGYIDPKRVASTISIVNNGFHQSKSLTVNDVVDTRFLPGPPKAKK